MGSTVWEAHHEAVLSMRRYSVSEFPSFWEGSQTYAVRDRRLEQAKVRLLLTLADGHVCKNDDDDVALQLPVNRNNQTQHLLRCSTHVKKKQMS
ncbi:hypothetical protein J1614_005996 [Plenodomus biglobosus]|nr:hypothetical protein J1614_005996 [Plenodomus biglobosus]